MTDQFAYIGKRGARLELVNNKCVSEIIDLGVFYACNFKIPVDSGTNISD